MVRGPDRGQYGGHVLAVGRVRVRVRRRGYVVQNEHVLNGLSLDGAGWALTAGRASNWHPLTWVSLQLDATLFGPAPTGFHRTNVLLHAATAALAHLALRRLTGSVGRSLAVALLFALHPLRVESVTWVSERKDVLSGLFWVLTLLAYGWYAAAPSRRRMAVVGALLVLGLMAKSMLVTLPFVLILLDFWPLGRLRTAHDLYPMLREKAVLFAAIICAAALTVYAQGSSGAVRSFEHVPLEARLAGVPAAYTVYLGSTAWPLELAAFYPISPEPRPLWQPLTAGRYDEAVRIAARAAESADRSGPPALAQAIRGRLDSYKNKKPYRTTP